MNNVLCSASQTNSLSQGQMWKNPNVNYLKFLFIFTCKNDSIDFIMCPYSKISFSIGRKIVSLISIYKYLDNEKSYLLHKVHSTFAGKHTARVWWAQEQHR